MSEKEQKETKKSEKVSFIWNQRIKNRKIIMVSASDIITQNGTMADNSKKRVLVVKDGIYSTTDKEEIDFLKAHPDFGAKHNKGFHVFVQPSAKDMDDDYREYLVEKGKLPADILATSEGK